MSNIKRIFILGHPGAGKGLFAQSIAKLVGWTFINADLELEHKLGCPINAIIGLEGLNEYNKTQLKLIKKLQEKQHIVIATDGPILDDPKTFEAFSSSNDLLVYLETSTETQLDRSKRNASHLLLGSMVELYDKLHQLRDESFKKYCHLIIDGNHSDIDYQVKQVIDKAEIDKLDDESILTEKDLTLFHKTSHESVEISHQQANCLKHMIRGLSAKEAAKEMNISYRTVEAHLSELKRKLGCESEKELIALYHTVI